MSVSIFNPITASSGVFCDIFCASCAGGIEYWTPSEITSTLWYDAKDESTITEVSGKVSQWNDKSGNDHHATQATPADRPTHDDANDAIVIGGGVTLSASGITKPTDGEWEAYLVGTVTNSGAYNAGMYKLEPAGNYPEFYFDGRITQDAWWAGDAGGKDFQNLETGLNLINEKHLLVYRHNETTGENALYLDGTEMDSSSVTGAVWSGDWTITIGVGGVAVNAGSICEILVLPNVGDTNRQLTEGYLAHVHGIANLLPANHPWKNARPQVGD